VKSIRVQGTDIRYLDQGTGLPLLLVHGFPLDHTMWAGQLDGLAKQPSEFLLGEAFLHTKDNSNASIPSVRMIAPDLRGFGRSAWKNGDDKVTMEQFADDLAGLLDGLNIEEPVVLCGLSMGGYIAFQFWRRHAARLAGLILCDTRATADAPEAVTARLELADRVLREGPEPLIDNMLPKLFAESTRRRQPQRIEGLRSVIMATDPRGIAAAARGMAARPDMTASLSKISCPTLVLVGQSDVISPPSGMRAIAESIPNATFAEISAAGHMAPLENPTEVNAAIVSFLATV
jgi:pimeloyl-ACP methyl ester carboxylesterase